MASQIAHIVYGKKIFNKLNLRSDNWTEFVIGTTFPDIRQLAKIKRNLLHKEKVNYEDVIKENPFETGLYVHSYVDGKREKYLKEEGAYNLIEFEPITVAAMKLVEDEMVYSRITNWPEISKYYENVLDEETKLVDKNIVKKWHVYLGKYISSKPNESVWRRLIIETTVYANLADDIINKIRMLKRNQGLMDMIKNTYNIF